MSDDRALVEIYGEAGGAAVDAASVQLQIGWGVVPSLREYTHNDGTVERLACLRGTVPTTPRTPDEPVYNIPVDIWFPSGCVCG